MAWHWHCDNSQILNLTSKKSSTKIQHWILRGCTTGIQQCWILNLTSKKSSTKIQHNERGCTLLAGNIIQQCRLIKQCWISMYTLDWQRFAAAPMLGWELISLYCGMAAKLKQIRRQSRRQTDRQQPDGFFIFLYLSDRMFKVSLGGIQGGKDTLMLSYTFRNKKVGRSQRS